MAAVKDKSADATARGERHQRRRVEQNDRWATRRLQSRRRENTLVTTAQEYYDKAKSYIASNNLTGASDMLSKARRHQIPAPADGREVDRIEIALYDGKSEIPTCSGDDAAVIL